MESLFSMKIFSIIFLILLIPLLSIGQKQLYISGYIKDSETDLPIEKASITLKNSKIAAITDKFGSFKIMVNKLPAEISISHICYNDIKVSIIDTNHLSLEIKLRYKVNLLKEVNINGLNVERISKYKQFWAMDYEFFYDNILLLNLNNNVSNATLTFVNYSGDTLSNLDLKKRKIKPVKLFKDCLDNVHIITQDTAYQIFYSTEKGLELKFPTEISKFEYLLNTCVTLIDSCVYYQYYDYHGFISQCYYINLNKKEEQFTIRTIFDSLTINRFEREFDKHYYIGLKKECHVLPWTVSDNELKQLRYFEGSGGQLGWFYPALYVPLVNVNDTLCVFNHCQLQIEFFTKTGKYINKVSIIYPKNNKWVQSIIKDTKTSKVYTPFLNNGIYTLREIDIRDGVIKRTIKIPELLFIEKIKVLNNYIYFLYRDRYKNSGDNKMLYRMKF